MQMYVNYYDRKVQKLEDENPTIGIILCKEEKQNSHRILLYLKNNKLFC